MRLDMLMDTCSGQVGDRSTNAKILNVALDGLSVVSCNHVWLNRTFPWKVTSGKILRTFSQPSDTLFTVSRVAKLSDRILIVTTHSGYGLYGWHQPLFLCTHQSGECG
jgi:hypothetical protein